MSTRQSTQQPYRVVCSEYRAGFTLIEIVIALGLLSAFFSAVFMVYFSILDVISNTEYRNAASAILSREAEVIRNLPYNQVGTVGGVPTGILAASKTVSSSVGVEFLIQTTVRNVDDPFDGIVGGSPNDTSPADYKLVELEVSCLTCSRFAPLIFTTSVAPENLESATNDGSLFINVYDANAAPIQGALIHVANASVTPAIDLFDTTNANGVLQLVGIPTSTQRYAITVTKGGYSSDRNYLPGNPANPNPVNSYSTVAAQTLTQTSFFIDLESTLTVHASDVFCSPFPNESFTLAGAKLIGTTPDVIKFSTSSAMESGGSKLFQGVEWDTYSATLTGSSRSLRGTIPLSPFIVNPSSSVDFRFVLATSSPNELLVTVTSATSTGPVSGATVHLSRTGYDATSTTGRATAGDTTWTGGNYSDQNGIDTASPAGTLTLLDQGGYSTSTPGWLTSRTFDLGGSSTTLHAISWNPVSQPGGTAVRFQIASNNDNATWVYRGPDGTSGTYYTASGELIHGVHANDRYVRYRVELETSDEAATPSISDISFSFTGVCVPPGHALFSGLSSATYTLVVSAPGFAVTTSSIAVGSGFQETIVVLSGL